MKNSLKNKSIMIIIAFFALLFSSFTILISNSLFLNGIIMGAVGDSIDTNIKTKAIIATFFSLVTMASLVFGIWFFLIKNNFKICIYFYIFSLVSLTIAFAVPIDSMKNYRDSYNSLKDFLDDNELLLNIKFKTFAIDASSSYVTCVVAYSFFVPISVLAIIWACYIILKK